MEVPSPRFVQFYPTTRCNQSCEFCFNPAAPGASEMSFREAIRLLDVLAPAGVEEVDVMGGEPLLLPWMPEFLHAVVSRGMAVNLSTNGSRPEMIAKLEGLPGPTVNIGISLEGSTATSHNRTTRSVHFEKAVESIAALAALGFDPIVKTVVTRTVLPEIGDIISLLRGKNVRRFFLIHMDLMSREESAARDAIGYTAFRKICDEVRETNADLAIGSVNASCFEKETLPPETRCAGGVRKLAVMPDGSVYPCNLLIRFGEFRLGDIFRDDFRRIWTSPRLVPFRTKRGACCDDVSCGNRPSCTGGCPAHLRLHTGSLDGRDIRCSLG